MEREKQTTARAFAMAQTIPHRAPRKPCFTLADIERIDAKMRTPPPLALHLRPNGPVRDAGDALARDAVLRQRWQIARSLAAPKRDEPFVPTRLSPSFSIRELSLARTRFARQREGLDKTR